MSASLTIPVSPFYSEQRENRSRERRSGAVATQFEAMFEGTNSATVLIIGRLLDHLIIITCVRTRLHISSSDGILSRAGGLGPVGELSSSSWSTV